MDVSLIESPDTADPGEVPFSLRPNRGRWAAMLRASRAVERGPAPPTAGQRAAAAASAVVGCGGVAALATLAAFQPALGGYAPAALLSALLAAGLPIALCIRRAVAEAEPKGPAAQGGAAPSRSGADGRAPGGEAGAAPVPASPAQGEARATVQRLRRHVRIRPRSTRTFIAAPDGRRLHAIILDVSQSGVALQGNFPGLWVGSMVTVGSRRAKVVRVMSRGMAFEFSLPVPPEALTLDFVL